MIYITQLIYVKEGGVDSFNEFEKRAMPIVLKYGGRLALRIRPDESSIIEGDIKRPYEVHLLEFRTELDFQNFMNDDERKEFLYLKEQSIQSSLLIKGEEI